MVIFLSIVGVVLLVAATALAISIIRRYRRMYEVEKAENHRLMEMRRKGLPVDLELAASDQLLKELRSRNTLNYIILWPTFKSEGMSLKMEIHNVDAARAIGVLQVATNLASTEIANQLRRPDMPDSLDYFE